MSEPVTIRLIVNGEERELEVDPRSLLVDVIRDQLGLTGTHVGCRTGHCGACTVLIGDQTAKSCTVLAASADGAEVLTIEGLARGDELHPLQEAFWQEHGLQCGYCTPGMLLVSLELLMENPTPTDNEIRHGLSGNLCRCTGYAKIVSAVQRGASMLDGGSEPA
jgi:carbon-monoxide dehydrogenase small subunit